MKFTTREVREIFSLKRNNFQTWIENGYVTPSINRSEKQGENNIFSKDDLYRIYLFIYLTKLGLSRKVAAEHAYIGFGNVGKENEAIKYMLVYVKIISDKASYRSTTLLGNKSEIDWPDDVEGFILVNLRIIKETVDNLISK